MGEGADSRYPVTRREASGDDVGGDAPCDFLCLLYHPCRIRFHRMRVPDSRVL